MPAMQHPRAPARQGRICMILGGRFAFEAFVQPFRKAAIRPAHSIPEAEIQSVIASIILMMLLVMAGGYHPTSQRGMNETTRKHFPPHVIGHAHDSRHTKNQAQHGNMYGDQKHKHRNYNRAAYAFYRMEAHRGPC